MNINQFDIVYPILFSHRINSWDILFCSFFFCFNKIKRYLSKIYHKLEENEFRIAAGVFHRSQDLRLNEIFSFFFFSLLLFLSSYLFIYLFRLPTFGISQALLSYSSSLHSTIRTGLFNDTKLKLKHVNKLITGISLVSRVSSFSSSVNID